MTFFDIMSKLEFLNVEFRIIANNQLINSDYARHIVNQIIKVTVKGTINYNVVRI